MKRSILLIIFTALFICTNSAWAGNYPIVDSGQDACFNNSRQIHCPDKGSDFYGQDAQYKGNQPRYKDNGDGTISDLVTGLMWVKERGPAVSWQQAMDGAEDCRVGEYSDWRAPNIKELYSLIDFNGWVQGTEKDSTPFINTDYFEFKFGDTSKGQRIIDCQDWSSTSYVSTTMGNNPTAFGVNFADGRIKGYGKKDRRGSKSKYVRYVRGNPDYGKNIFVDRKDGTIADKATGLIWQKQDSVKKLNWEEALSYCENLNYAGRDDWRLPSVKELQSIVDYARSPKTSGTAAIDPIFKTTKKESYCWSSTTHMDGPKPSHASYVAFGRAWGYFGPPSSSKKTWMDVHGAGAQRSDPKSGDPDDYPNGRGPQGDDIRIYNYVRCVTGGGVEPCDPPYTRIPTWKGGNPGGNSGSGMGMSHMDNNRQQRNRNQGMNSGMRQGRMQGGMGMGQGRGPGNGQGPPEEAFTACENKSQGDDCTVETPHGTLNGQCVSRGEQTFCVPEGHGRGMGGRPRQ
ncbi:DUF1566 domain-containing protein [Desulfovibrio sp. JC010]|uniref:Lcl C-terminal domain-containing protein n=1 Tax=Desulfovibrio sp. JC010 TaxID=2593641 RepID=UPI0013D5FB98|nr:DUF1566 domain-containing protein [Desulfovibrio sp. JC010]NDV25251.1 DUF1566 domain-containing protein [Desulfovibrio sp. JC010]